MALVEHNFGMSAVRGRPSAPASAPTPAAPTHGTAVRSSSASSAGVSRLAQLQARFQKKQMQEKEEKLLRLYESQQQRAFQRVGRGSAGSVGSSLSSSTSTLASVGGSGGGGGGGKVRQLFEERRNGWDRSYPLDPLAGGKAPAKPQQNALPLAVPKTKAARGASLDRGPSQQPKSNVRRSKSHARDHDPSVVARNAKNNHARRPSNSVDHYEEDYREIDYDRLGDYDYVQDKRQEELFAKYQVRELADEDLLTSSSPPPELDDDLDDETYIYDKLPNVGRLRNEEPVNPSDRFKTYNTNKHNRGQFREEASRPVQAQVNNRDNMKKAPVNRRESVSPPTKAVSKPAPKKAEQQKVGATSRTAYQTNTSSVTSKHSLTTQQKSTVNMLKSPNKSPVGSDRSLKNGQTNPGRTAAAARDDLVECHNCQRRFAADRIKVHEDICLRTAQRKRKEYDAIKHRVQGTEAEQFVRRAMKQGQVQKKIEVRKPDWRKKHEEFIQTIRAAKEMQAHVAAGGKISDLPPPPPLDTSDYIQCPHCGRRFNEAAAERHIPRCANMQHNKPKPPQNRFTFTKRR